MCSSIGDEKRSLIADDEQKIELILDLTRRIQLLEDLMSAAQAKRRIAAEGVSTPVAHGAINGTNIQ
ncbi:MAG TPA: hypothetical protein VGS27_23035 [Candidatus Sulfotelmatobacter sp.]|nr:hypothetical protein [Candidatus Sulfotelmatobacter sp.]